MRTTEERLDLIRQRTAALKAARKQQALSTQTDTAVYVKKRQRITDILCIAACLALVLFLGLSMPELSSHAATDSVRQVYGTASLLGDTKAAGYILTGLLSFLLGMGVTVLLFRLHQITKSGPHGEDDDEL